jgi:hypothetical protein
VIDAAKRLPVTERKTKKARAGDAAVEVACAGGIRDLIVSSDTYDGSVLLQPDWDLETDAALCLVRREGGRTMVTAVKGTYVRCGKWKADIDAKTGLLEAEF